MARQISLLAGAPFPPAQRRLREVTDPISALNTTRPSSIRAYARPASISSRTRAR